jgi:hypothetical protein
VPARQLKFGAPGRDRVLATAAVPINSHPTEGENQPERLSYMNIWARVVILFLDYCHLLVCGAILHRIADAAPELFTPRVMALAVLCSPLCFAWERPGVHMMR